MAIDRIDTKEKLREYIKRRLGAPLLRVELTEDMLNDCIDKAIYEYSYYAYDGTIEGTLLVELTPGVFEYKLDPRIHAVSGLQASSTYSTFIHIPAGYTLAMNPITLNMQDNVSNIDIQSMTQRMAKMSNLRNLFDVQVNFDYNSNNSTLYFFEEPVSSVAVLEIAMDYEPGEVDGIYNNQLIKKMAEGEAWKMWANVTGKYSSQLVNGSEINYGDMQSKGEAMCEAAKEEMMELREPLGVYIF
jgi:hypothetical protein